MDIEQYVAQKIQNREQNVNGSSPKNSIQQSNVVPTFSGNSDQEFAQIIDELALSGALHESAMYRIYRMKVTGKWADVTDLNTGEKYFPTWEDFVKTVGTITGNSRQKIFDRVKAYQELSAIGFTPEEMIMKMTEAPTLYTRALKLLCNFDVRTDKILSLTFDDADDHEDAAKKLRNIVDDLSSFERSKDALDYIQQDILLEPVVQVFVNEDGYVILNWTVFDRTKGAKLIQDEGTVEFKPSSTMPDWVAAEFSRIVRNR